MDRQVLALLVAPIKAAFGLSDTRVGMLQGVALNLCFGLATLPLGLFVDRGNRVMLICFAAVGWSGFTALSGLCTNFWQLFACRMGVGVAEAGLAPAALSLIADLYSLRTRSTATLVFYGAAVFGASAGVALGGLTIDFISNYARTLPLGLKLIPVWRLTFLAASFPGLIVAISFIWVKEPCRKTHQNASVTTQLHSSLSAFLRTNWLTIACLCGGLVTSGIGIDALFMWMPAVLGREYGLLPARSGEWLGLIFGIGSVCGIALAGGLVRALRGRWGLLAPLQVLRIGVLASEVALPGLLFARSANQMLVLVLAYILLAFVASAVGPGLVIGIAPNHLRGRVYAIWISMTVIAATIWPTLIGALSDRAFHGPHGLTLALCAVIVPCSFLAPVMLAAIVEPFRRTMSAQVPINESEDV